MNGRADGLFNTSISVSISSSINIATRIIPEVVATTQILPRQTSNMTTFSEAFASDKRTIAVDCDDVLCQTNATVAESEHFVATPVGKY